MIGWAASIRRASSSSNIRRGFATRRGAKAAFVPELRRMRSPPTNHDRPGAPTDRNLPTKCQSYTISPIISRDLWANSVFGTLVVFQHNSASPATLRGLWPLASSNRWFSGPRVGGADVLLSVTTQDLSLKGNHPHLWRSGPTLKKPRLRGPTVLRHRGILHATGDIRLMRPASSSPALFALGT